MAFQWTLPPNGAPCWINIYAKDIQRGSWCSLPPPPASPPACEFDHADPPLTAKQFYSTVFDWNFRNESVHENPSHAPEQIARFHFPGGGTGGGITKLEEAEFISTRGKGGATLFLYVDNLQAYMEVSQTEYSGWADNVLT